jgi:hypothetical protein
MPLVRLQLHRSAFAQGVTGVFVGYGKLFTYPVFMH